MQKPIEWCGGNCQAISQAVQPGYRGHIEAAETPCPAAPWVVSPALRLTDTCWVAMEAICLSIVQPQASPGRGRPGFKSAQGPLELGCRFECALPWTSAVAIGPGERWPRQVATDDIPETVVDRCINVLAR